MAKQHGTRTQTVSIRMSRLTQEATERAAHMTGRTVSSFLEFAVQQYMREHMPQAFMQPMYYTAHPDGVFRAADPQPTLLPKN